MFNKKVKQVINVDGMSCSHCAKRVENSLKEVDGVIKVSVNLDKKEVIIISKFEIDTSLLRKKIEDLGYKYLDEGADV